MKWRKNLYIGKSVKKHTGRIRKRLESGKTDVGHYLITFAENEKDQLDIINTIFLISEKRREELPEIIGIAGSEEEAIELVEQMIRDCLKSTGSADVRKWLVAKQ